MKNKFLNKTAKEKDRRIKFSDVFLDSISGLRLMEGFYWNYKKDYHALITGSVSSSRSDFTFELLKALMKIGKVEVISSYNLKISEFCHLSNVNALSKLKNIYDCLRYHFGYEDEDCSIDYHSFVLPDFILIDDFDLFCRGLSYTERNNYDEYITFIVNVGPQFGLNVIFSGNKPSADVLVSSVKENLSLRLVVGGVSVTWYEMMFNQSVDYNYMALRRKVIDGHVLGTIAIFGNKPQLFPLPSCD